jgi:hypothetical protein
MPTHRWRFVAHVSLGLVSLLLTPFTGHAVEVISGPTLTMDPSSWTPLAGVVELETDEAVQAMLTITDGTDLWTVDFPVPTQQHYLPVLGLKADRTYTVDVDLVPGGRAGTVFATTDPLPANFPTLITTVSNPAAMEPGYTMLDCFSRGAGNPETRYGIIVDSAGEVVWYSTKCFGAGRQQPDGTIYWRHATDQQAVVMDMLGFDTRLPLQLPGLRLHHDLLRTPHGTWLSLDQQSVDVPDFPTSETDPAAPTAPATLLDDSVVEFLPDGTLRREWPLVGMLDLTRIGYDSLRASANGLDWTHSNAVHYDPADDSIIVSVRHQDAIIKFSRETGELVWILGPHDNWSADFQQYLLHPVGSGFLWEFHPHAPMWTGTGNLLLFDNGNWRASPFDGTTPMPAEESFSRGVEYEINEQNMHVRQVWEYGENAAERLFASFISDADWMETTGNRLMTFGGTRWVDGVSSADLGMGDVHTRIIETAGDEVVFALTAFDPAGGWIATYRSERIPSLYPQQYFKTPNGVGDTLRLDTVSGVLEMTWSASPIDSEHDAADYYMIYTSTSPAGGFTMLDSTASTNLGPGDSAEPLVFYRVVAANLAGTSGDEPAP